jgi:hypothetical protein
MMPQLYTHRSKLVRLIREKGIRAFGRKAGVSAMLVSRFCDGSGADDADTLYLFSHVAGYRLVLLKGAARLRTLSKGGKKVAAAKRIA